MCWRRAKGPPVAPAGPRGTGEAAAGPAARGGRTRFWPGSITARLTLLYTVVTCGMLVAAGMYLYWVLENSLTQGDRQFLVEEVDILRLILRDRPRDPTALDAELNQEAAARQFNKYYGRVTDAAGRLLQETPGMSPLLPPAAFPAPVPVGQAPTHGQRWRSAEGRQFFLLAAWAPVGRSGRQQALIQAALEISQERRLAADYRRHLVGVVALGMVVAAVGGAWVARRGLGPLAAIARTAQRITAARLGERIGPTGWPREIAVLAAAFDAMLQRLDESFTKLSQFSADLAHELRTPIHNLRGETEVALRRARSPEEYRAVLESNLEEYERLSRMIDSLLFLARAESAERQIQKHPLDGRRELEAVREFYDAVAAERQVHLTCEGSGGLLADSGLVRRALSNLFANALRHTPRGGRITAVLDHTDHTTRVTVRDTGAGIAREHLPRVFERFYRADPARADSAHGTGLGLAIVRSIMDLHGGKVRIESEPGKGTAVTLSFPAE